MMLYLSIYFRTLLCNGVWGGALWIQVLVCCHTISLAHYLPPQGSQSRGKATSWDRDRAIGATQLLCIPLRPRSSPGAGEDSLQLGSPISTPSLGVWILWITSTATCFIIDETELCHPNPAKFGVMQKQTWI